MKNKIFAIFFLTFIASFSQCTKDDNEPLPQSGVSRLYVSNADVDAAVPNTMIFDPADGKTLPIPYNFDSKLPDGNGIFFDPFSGTVYQVSRRDKTVRTLTVNTDGKLTIKGSFSDASLVSAREIAFDRTRQLLYVASNIDSAIYVYSAANTLKDAVTANKKLKLSGQPWGIHLDKDNLYVVIDQSNVEVQLFEAASSLAVGTIKPTKSIKIAGAKRLHGITYSSERDAMLLTDIGDPATSTDGAIYLIDSVETRFKASVTTINPKRIISGSNTMLGNPVDIAWDSRTGKDLIYIAEKANRHILMFKFTDNGNVQPSLKSDLQTSPEAIYLDAR